MRRIFKSLKDFFFPAPDASKVARILPLAIVAVIVILIVLAGNYVWETTNDVEFCGLTCHTMPPEYVTHNLSAHTNVSCEDCHMGRGRFFTLLPRKIEYSWQTGSALVFKTYHYPIVARNMRPARDACENCHKPEVFSSDTLVEIKHFLEDAENTPISTFLVIKTGGGSRRQGLGYGIHWHIENPVYFYATDERRQNIPYVLVTRPDGSEEEYVDVESGFDPRTIDKSQLQKMDCITCHNRTAHLIESPSRTMDGLLARGLVSTQIPEIKKKGTEVLSASYASQDEALATIASLDRFYEQAYPDFYRKNKPLLDEAIKAIQETYKESNFPEQLYNWRTHPDNAAHEEFPGCFRCHDGKHLNRNNEAVRLECNLCHSIPVVGRPGELVSRIEISRGVEPPSHLNPNWILLHRDVFDNTCSTCHTVEDPGGISDTSFCSNSACHGRAFEFAGFDAPQVRQLIGNQLQQYISTPTPTATISEVEATPSVQGTLSYTNDILPVLQGKCAACHGDENGSAGLQVTTYAALMKGGKSGVVVIPGEPDQSLLIQLQSRSAPHFGQFSSQELQLVKDWISAGAVE